MKKKDLFTLFHGLKAVGKYPGAKFAYAVAKNLAVVTAECQLIEKTNEMSDKFKEYADKRYELAKTLGTIDERGTVIVTEDKQAELKALLAPLDKQFKEAIKERAEQEKGYAALLEDAADITLHKISADILPEAITSDEVTAILPIIED